VPGGVGKNVHSNIFMIVKNRNTQNVHLSVGGWVNKLGIFILRGYYSVVEMNELQLYGTIRMNIRK